MTVAFLLFFFLLLHSTMSTNFFVIFDAEKLWKEPDRKIMKYCVVMEKMISKARSRSNLAQEATKDEAFKLWLCALFSIASAGFAVISFLKW